jgi:cell division protein FtsN
MSRDYKGRSRSPGGKGSAFVSGLFIGLLLGLGAAVGIAWYIYRVPSPFLSKDKPADAKSDKAVPAKPEAVKPVVPVPDKPRFEFYKILPGSEEPLSDQQIKEAAKKRQPARDLYFLQAGAFQNPSDADNLKAKLALLGVEATISTTSSAPDKGIVHRVRVGPYSRLEDFEQARQMLKQNGIETTPIKAKEAAQ